MESSVLDSLSCAANVTDAFRNDLSLDSVPSLSIDRNSSIPKKSRWDASNARPLLLRVDALTTGWAIGETFCIEFPFEFILVNILVTGPSVAMQSFELIFLNEFMLHQQHINQFPFLKRPLKLRVNYQPDYLSWGKDRLSVGRRALCSVSFMVAHHETYGQKSRAWDKRESRLCWKVFFSGRTFHHACKQK